MSLRDEFYQKHLRGTFDRIYFWILCRRIKRMKLAQLWESYMDLMFLEAEMRDDLQYDETEDRKELAKERQKPLDQQNEKRIDEIEGRISKAKAVKMTYRKTKEFIDETNRYLKMLELWGLEDDQK